MSEPTIKSQMQALEYIALPGSYFPSQHDYFCMTAKNGKHFKSFGIRDGSLLVFMKDTEIVAGQPSCYGKLSSKNIVKYKLSKKPVAGYEHLGRLVGCLTQWN